MKYTYLLECDKISKELRRLWKRYQSVLKNPNWKDLNETRAILYLIGQIYCEKIAPEAIERRLHLLKDKLSLNDFFELIDSKDKKLTTFRKDKIFKKLEKFYLIVKKYKNKNVGGKFYLDEERFIKLYNQYNPNKKLKIGYRGKF